MKGNVTCSCGHSWNKSDSSKKDANLCHICGKDNTMKDGGWLDKYQKGGSVNERMDNEIVGFLKNLITPEVTRSDAPARITTAPKDQSLNSKMWDVVSHPVTAFKHLVNEGRLPNNFAAASPLGIDTALDITGLNPLGYASLFHDMGASTLNLVTGKGSLGDLITLPVTGLAMLPGAKTAANIVGRHMASNSNFYSPIFNTIEKGANKIGSKVKQVDQKLGEKIFTNKDNLPQVRDIDPSDLESSINYNLKKGLGIKKIDLPMSVTVTKNTSSGNNFNIGNILDGQRTGSVTLEQNLNPFKKQSLSRGVIDAIYPKGNAWANTPGFKKLSDFPFSNIESGNSAITYSGSDYNYNDLINSGVSGELNKAINETLKANNLGNIISGGTGHSTLGKKRWDNLVSKGHAENLGPGKYKLKENGGWLDKYEDGGELNYNDSNASAGPGFQGDGYSNVGRNYSPAWGGQFKDGGPVKRFMQPTETFKNFGYNPKEKGLSTEYSTSIGGPGEVYLVPGYRQGRLLDDPEATFNMYGEHLGGPFKTVQAAEDFAQLRHKYVEQNKNLPAPFKTRDYAMGGSIPGAVGFTYARTGSIPSNGKYAKKTKASAQNGTEMEYYQNGLDWKPRSMAKGGEVVPGENEELQIPSAWDDEKVFIKNNPRLRGSTPGSVPRFMPPQMLDLDQFEVEDVNYDQAALKHFVNSLTPAESKNYIPKMEDKFDTMENMYNTKSTKFDEDWSKLNSLDKSSNKIKLNTGRFRGAKVPTNIIDELAETSRKQNVPLGQLLTLMGRESMFGSGAEANQGRASNKTDLMSGWNIAEDYQPYEHLRFLADNKVPGIKTNPTPHGYDYDITDDRAMNNYLRKNPKILEQYQQKLDSAKSLGGQDAFDLTAKFLKKKGVKGYNPNDPNYTNLFNQDYNLLKQDKNLMKYVKQKGYTFEDGGSLELTKLDQLTNFTNYNTKQPGGWLDKYES